MFSFDNVLICPKRSKAPSRSAIILERERSGTTWKGIPIFASNMNTLSAIEPITRSMSRNVRQECQAKSAARTRGFDEIFLAQSVHEQPGCPATIRVGTSVKRAAHQESVRLTFELTIAY